MRNSARHSAGAVLVGTVLLAACGERFATATATPTGLADARAVVLSGSQIVVNSALDPGNGVCTDDECTLREAIGAVDAGGEIVIAVASDITLTSGELLVSKPMTIRGPGMHRVVSGQNQSRVFYLNGAGAVTLRDFALAHGNVDGPGGCLRSDGSNTILYRMRVMNCSSQGAGGGVSASQNGLLLLEEVLVSGNWAANGGGGVYIDFSVQGTFIRSTISNNTGREGGGIGTTGRMLIQTSTVSGNNARFHGGGVYAADRDADAVRIRHSTIVGNTADSDGDGTGDGGGIFNSNGSMDIVGTILAHNADAGGQAMDCGAISPKQAVGSFNLILDLTGCGAYATTAAVSGMSPILGPLTNNGGSTPTHLPASASPVIDMGGNACISPDQRGVIRPIGAACDIGAVEVAPVLLSIDVRPGSSTNPVNLRPANALLPVAILSTSSFDATLLDVATIRLGNASVALRQNGQPFASVEDVNGDGRPDLVVHFTVGAIGLTPTSTSVTLQARDANGSLYAGSDLVQVVP